MEVSNQTPLFSDPLNDGFGEFVERPGSSVQRFALRDAPANAVRYYRLFLRNWDHQFCLWGHDINASERDLLRLYGLKRLPKQTGFSSSAAYLETGRRELSFDLCLWAFGAYLSVPKQGIWVWSRHDLRLKLAPSQCLEDPWCLMRNAQLSRTPSIEELRQGMPHFRDFVGWMARYEGWIQDHFNSSHRRKAEPLATNLGPYWEEVESSLCVARYARLPRVGIL